MKITEGLKSLERKIEHELTAFFLILGESEMPESGPLQQSDKQAQNNSQPQPH